MQLLYRGIAYESDHPSTQNPKMPPQREVRLTYRGHSYDYQPQPQPVDQIVPSDVRSMTLMYRGQTYQRQVLAPRDRQPSRSINWHWQPA
jgi:hypothetical protein